MKLFAKRALLLTILVLCLFGISVLAASAAGTEYADDATAVAAGAVARVGDAGGAGYYNDLSTAIAEAPTGSTVTVLKDTQLFANKDSTKITGKTLTIKGADKYTITPSDTRNGVKVNCAFSLVGKSTLNIENLVFSGYDTKNFLFFGSGDTTCEVVVNMTGVDVSWANASGAIYGYGGKSATLNLEDCLFDTSTADAAVVRSSVAVTDGVNVNLTNCRLGGVAVWNHAQSVGTVNIVNNTPTGATAQNDTHVAAFTVGSTTYYYTTVKAAIVDAPNGATITVLKNAALDEAVVLGSKSLTIQGATADVVVTSSKAIQLNGGVVSLTIKNLTVNPSANFLDIYTSTDTHTVKLENVTMNPTAAANANLLYVSKTKANIEIVDCTVNATNANRLVTVGSGGNLVDYKVTDSTFTNIYVARAENAGVIGSASNPAQLTNLASNKVLFYAYTGTVYADIYGGAFTGPLVYGGDNHNNYLGFRINPTGDTTTTFTFAAGNKYGAFVYQNPGDATKNSMSFSFRNTTVADSGKQAIINGTLTKANVTITIENSTFGESALAAGGSPKYLFGTDADAKAYGMAVRIGEEGTGAAYYTTLTDALNAAPADNGNGGATMIYVIANTTHSAVGNNGNQDAKFCKKVHITSVGATPFTVTGGAASSVAFFTGNGAELTFTNITWELAGRFARIDGNTAIVFGNGTTINHSDTIFVYDNGNSYTAGGDTDDTTDDVFVSNFHYSFDIQEGAVINANGAIGTGLFYKNDTKNPATITMKIAGTINMAAKKPVFHAGSVGTLTLEGDFATFANITCTADATYKTWFAGSSANNVFLKLNGFASTSDAATWAYTYTNASGLTYNADPAAAYKYTFVYHAQFTHVQYNVLNSNGGEIWQIRNAGSIYQTAQFTNLGTVTMKSYNGATITFQGDAYRFRVNGGTTLILDGIELKAPGVILAVQSASADKPATLKLVNGAKLTGTAITKKAGDTVSTLAVLDGPYTSIYVDETSEMTQTGEVATYGSALIYAYSAWANGTIEIKGKIASTVTSESDTLVVNMILTNSDAYTAKIIFNGATVEPAAEATIAWIINAPNDFNGEVITTDTDMNPDLINGITEKTEPVPEEVELNGEKTSFEIALEKVVDGDIIYVLKDLEISETVTVAGISITIQGKTGNEKLTMVPKKEMFFIGNNAHITFKNINVTADRFVVFKQNTAGATAELTLDEGAIITNHDLAADNDVLVYNGQANGNVTINIKAGASLITQSLSEVDPEYGTIQASSGASTTLNVWGTLKNLAQAAEGKTAQVFVAKGATNNATLNVYEGAVIEGTSDSVGYSGSYSGIVYYSQGTQNAINIYGGTITIHGRTGLAYTGSKCDITLSGGTINNVEAQYAMFFGGNQSMTVTGLPVVNKNGQALLNKGTLHITLKIESDEDYDTAVALGCTFMHEESMMAYGSLADLVATIPAGGSATIRILAKATSPNITVSNVNLTFIGRDTLARNLSATSAEEADLYFNGTSGYVFSIKNAATITFRDIAVFAGRPLFNILEPDDDSIAAEDRKVTINFINASASGGSNSSIFMATAGTYKSFELNVDADSKLMFAPNSSTESAMFKISFGIATEVIFNINGTLEVEDRYTSGARAARVFKVEANRVVNVNISDTARIYFTCTEDQASVAHSVFDTNGGAKVYVTMAPEAIINEVGDCTLGNAYLYAAGATGLPMICVPVANTDWQEALSRVNASLDGVAYTPFTLYTLSADGYVYHNSFDAALSTIEAGEEVTVYVFATTKVAAEVKIVDKSLTIVGEAIADPYHLSVSKYFALYSKGTLTFEGLQISATAQLVDFNANEAVAGEKENKNVTINFVNTTVDADGAMTMLISSRNHYATDKGGCGEQAYSVTVNVDADSVINFTTSATTNVYFIAFNHNSHPYCYANINGSVTINSTGATLSAFELIHSNNPTLTHLNITETAKLIINIAADCENAYLVTYSTGSTKNHVINIALDALINEMGDPMLDTTKVKLYYASITNGHVPQVCITATSDELQETFIKALLAVETTKVGNEVTPADVNPILYRVDFDGKLHYYNNLECASADAQENSTTIIYLYVQSFATVQDAIAAGAIFRLGGEVADGMMNEHYFKTLAELLAYVTTSRSTTDVEVYVLVSTYTEATTVNLAGIKLTLDSIDAQQTLTMTANPAFKLGADAHLVIKNVKIVITNSFAQNVNADAEKSVVIDLENGAYVDITNYKSSNSEGYFFQNVGSGNKGTTGLVTVNVKAGATINRVTTTGTTGGTYGLFQISPARGQSTSAAGSSINVSGTINFGLTYTAAGYAPVFMWGDKYITININDGAAIDLCHVGGSMSTWGAIVLVECAGTVNVGNATLKAANNYALFGINGLNLGATLNVTGATFTAENFPTAVINDYVSGASDNTQKFTFTNCTFSCKLSVNDRATGVDLINATFASEELAKANYGVLRLGNDVTTGYYSKFASAIAATPNGDTLWVVGNISAKGVVIANKTLTIQGVDATARPVITNSSDGSTTLFNCVGNTNLTLKDLEINAKARAVNFKRDTVDDTAVDVTDSSLNVINTDIYGVAVGVNHNDMIGLGDGKGHHNFDLYIDKDSSVGYKDGDPSVIKSTRDYQVIFYYASVTGNLVIDGDVYAYVYFIGDKVDYEKVESAWTSWGPNSQHLIQLGSGSTTFTGNVVINGTLTHKVVFPDKDQNGQPVYPEQYPSRHAANAIYVIGSTGSIFVAESATITIDYTNAYAPNATKINFTGGAYQNVDSTYNGASGKVYYSSVGSLLGFLTWNGGEKITVATGSGSNYGIVYDNTTHLSTDSETGEVKAGGYDYYGATEIAALLSQLTGATIEATKDTTTSTKEIIVGIANRDVVQQYLPEIAMNEYAIVITADKILVLAWHGAALEKAYAEFKIALKTGVDGTTVYLPNVTGVFTAVANTKWVDDFTKPANGTLWGGQYVDNNSLQYVYNGYANTKAGQDAFMAYCDVLVSEGYTLVWQNVIENNLFRMYQNETTGLALYVAYNDYDYKDEYYGTNGNDGLYGQEESDKTNLPTINLSDDYFENRDHQKVLRVISMPLDSVVMPDEGINVPDFTYNKVTNTLQTTLSFQSSSVGLGHVYMLEDGRFLVIDGGGTGNTNEGDKTEHEAIYEVMKKMYTDVYGHEPTEEQPIHIAAWYLTHTHWDHFSAFTHFAKNYGANIVLDYVIANVPVQSSVYKNAEVQYASDKIATVISYFKDGNAKYMKVCTGQRLYLANLEIEVLMTFMDHAPFDIVNTNDTNTVTRFNIHNKDAMNGVTAQVLYLGDSWRHSSRILCEMYGDYLQTEIVQLAHHGNIGCERILYKTVAPRAVYFSHNAPSFKSYVYFSSISGDNANVSAAFRYAADVWCAYNAEYVWSAPYGVYNKLEFLPSRPDYENIKDLFTGSVPDYDTSYTRNGLFHTEKAYIHNVDKGYKSVNIVWGDFGFTYQGGAGVWSPEELNYVGGGNGAGWVATGDNRIFVGNSSTGSDQTINVELKFTPASSDYNNFTGTFKSGNVVAGTNPTVMLLSKEYRIYEFVLNTTSLPTTTMNDVTVGQITVTLK